MLLCGHEHRHYPDPLLVAHLLKVAGAIYFTLFAIVKAVIASRRPFALVLCMTRSPKEDAGTRTR